MPDSIEWLMNTMDGVMVVDGEQKVVLWNRGAEEILGFSAEEAQERDCFEMLGGRDVAGRPICERNCQAHSMARGGEAVPTFDLWVRTRNNHEIWLNLTTVSLKRRKDSLLVVHLFRDVSRQKEVERFVQEFSAIALRLLPHLELEPLHDIAPFNPLPNHLQGLTTRELEILHLLASGASTRAISKKLCISPSTVKNHIQSLMVKVRAHTRLEAVSIAFRQGLI